MVQVSHRQPAVGVGGQRAAETTHRLWKDAAPDDAGEADEGAHFLPEVVAAGNVSVTFSGGQQWQEFQWQQLLFVTKAFHLGRVHRVPPRGQGLPPEGAQLVDQCRIVTEQEPHHSSAGTAENGRHSLEFSLVALQRRHDVLELRQTMVELVPGLGDQAEVADHVNDRQHASAS
ncbi:MAG TPA: hypothetical protein VHX38_26385 [Pseudonocardiaceae bacterium]|nr:hypothetical protein [Pseudonocardiaceae bacterium]